MTWGLFSGDKEQESVRRVLTFLDPSGYMFELDDQTSKYSSYDITSFVENGAVLSF